MFPGDIVPDKPHMFIVMFVLVIVGLSIVSMFISVVQIKIEEWLCRMIEQIKVSLSKITLPPYYFKQFQEEYMKKDGLVDPEEIKRIFANDPVLSFVAPKIMSGEQNHMLKDTIKKFDRLLESKEIQTDFPVKGMATQVEKYEQVS